MVKFQAHKSTGSGSSLTLPSEAVLLGHFFVLFKHTVSSKEHLLCARGPKSANHHNI